MRKLTHKFLSFYCWITDHDWIYTYETYFGEAFERYYERWEERHCERCGKRQERKLWEHVIKKDLSI